MEKIWAKETPEPAKEKLSSVAQLELLAGEIDADDDRV